MDSNIDEQPEPPIAIESSKLSNDALIGIIENYIMRSGTDYGTVEASHELKIKQVKHQISNEEVKVVYDPNTESVTLMTARDFKAALKELPSN
jgi:uncharacterized protein YheU (UPF0270 family)